MGDWLARTTMLVLAALATLALIGSLASVSNSRIGDAFPGGAAEPPPVGTPPVPASDRQVVEPGTGTMTIEGAASAAPTPPPTPRAGEREIARWLRALTYAVLALAVIAAAGVVALIRVATHLRRIAER